MNRCEQYIKFLFGDLILLVGCEMQRSRRALLVRRRVSETTSNGRNRFYKVSLSLVFLIWGLVFLSTLWISHVDGDKGNFLSSLFGQNAKQLLEYG